MATPLKPTTRLIEQFWGDRQELESYRLQDASLELLFARLCPANNEIEQVLLKVSALNDFYSTRIFNTYAVAKHICVLEVDRRLEAVDYTLVNDIAKVTVKRGVTRNFYSFASKYCSHHRQDSYPIWDYYVVKMLLHYRRTHKFSRFKKEELKDFPTFVGVMSSFRTFFGLDSHSLREIDNFLWLGGKKWFRRDNGGPLPQRVTKSPG